VSVGGGPLRYRGTWFCAASRLPLQGGLSDLRRLTRLLGSGVIRPWRLAALLAFVSGAPRLRIRLSASPAGRLLDDHFGHKFVGVFPHNRLCRAVLLLPADGAGYLRGRHRHAARNNLNRAAKAEISSRELTDAAEALTAMQSCMLNRKSPVSRSDLAQISKGWSVILDRPEVTVLAAGDPAGKPLAVAAAVIDDEVCLLRLALAVSHEARWALHQHLVEILIDRGVRYLVVHADGPFGALGAPPHIQYYQHLLGYQVFNINPQSIRRRHRPPGRDPLQ
jgi:hypothetical protein